MNNEALYLPIEPYQVHYLSVDPPHVLYVEESGNPKGIPVIFLHGGPGASTKPSQRRTFDPAQYRIILFDQRGCGRSSPSAELSGNDTDTLIADIERIRMYLGIDAWMVAGGSWGSYLTLAYAIAHPTRCLALRLHGIFLGRPHEVRFWFHGIGSLFPDAFEQFAAHVEEDERDDLLKAYHRRLTNPDPAVHMAAAAALRGFSSRTQTLIYSSAHVGALTTPKTALEVSRLFANYCVNGFFQPENHLLDNIKKIRHIPCEIVQGRYDVVTPAQSAWDLHRAWPEARFTLVELANHVATPEAPDISTALRAASDRLADGSEALPIEAYLAGRAYHSPAVSEDGTTLAWISDVSGFDQLWSMDMANSGSAVQRTSLNEKVGGFAFRPGGRDIVFNADNGGDEHHQLYFLRDGDSAAKPLTAAPGVVYALGCFDQTGRRMAYASNAANAKHMQIHLRDLETSEDRVVLQGDGWRTPRSFTPDGSALLIEDNIDGMYDAALRLCSLEDAGLRQLTTAGKGTHIYAAKWIDDGASLLLATDAEQSFHGLAQMDTATAALTWLAQPDGDVELFAVSKDQTGIAYAWNDEGYSRISVIERNEGKKQDIDLPFLGRVTSLMFTPDQSALIMAVSGFRGPSQILRITLKDGAHEVLCKDVQNLTQGDTVEPVIEHFPSFDGAAVPAFVFTPLMAAPAGGYPIFVVVHGGPESQYAAHWRSDVQYLVRRGWLVVAPNVRGSTGYGRDWQAGDDLDKRMDSVRDLKALHDGLAARDDVDATRMVVSGQSYGGFMVLAAITEHPQDWCVAVNFYGIVDFNTLMATTGPWRRALRVVEYGDPDTADGRALLAEISPFRKVDNIKTPLFLAHGGDDPRVPPSESELIFAALRGRGHDCELVRIDHEGHGFARLPNRERVFSAMMRFIETRTRAV